MKKPMKWCALLLLTTLFFGSCSESEVGKVDTLIPEKIVVEKEESQEQEISEPTDSIEKLPTPIPQKPIRIEPKPQPEPPIISRGYEPPPIWRQEPDDREIDRMIRFPIPPQDQPELVDFPDVDATYVGGAAAMVKFIQENINYPEGEMVLDVPARVYVQFIVEKDGSLSKVEVMRSVMESLDAEAIRVIRAMPNWKPGESNGEVVRCRMRLPITFTLQ